MSMKRKCIQNPFKHFKIGFFGKTTEAENYFRQKLLLKCLHGSEYASVNDFIFQLVFRLNSSHAIFKEFVHIFILQIIFSKKIFRALTLAACFEFCSAYS